MTTPKIPCSIEAVCDINPSEDPKKIELAISNVIPNTIITINKSSMKATSKDLDSLIKIHERIHSKKKQKVYLRNFQQNFSNYSTWFYLNKQAAFVDKVALCAESDESPLGPIKVIVKSKRIEELTEWLLS